jgi:hypothetical protein
MKHWATWKVGLCCAAMALLSMPASAAIVTCPTQTTLADLLTIASGAGNGCQSQDKIFTNFSYSLGSTDAGSVTATLVAQLGGSQDIHGWVFAHAGNWSTNFTLSYTISVAPGFPNTTIIASKDQLNTGFVPNGSSDTDTQTPNVGSAFAIITDGSIIGGETAQHNWPAGVTSINVSNVVVAGPNVISVENDFIEQVSTPSVPEPGTITLMLGGIGFVGLGLIRRRRRS